MHKRFLGKKQIDYRKFFFFIIIFFFFCCCYNLDNFFPLKNAIKLKRNKCIKKENESKSCLAPLRMNFACSIWLLTQLNHWYFSHKAISLQAATVATRSRKREAKDTFYLNFISIVLENRLLYCNHRIMSQLKHYNIILGSENLLRSPLMDKLLIDLHVELIFS